MRRRRYYGKPPPSKEQVQAHYDFYAQVNEAVQQEGKKMNMQLSKAERGYLIRLISVDYQRMNAEVDHAICHGADVVLPDFDIAANILIELEDA